MKDLIELSALLDQYAGLLTEHQLEIARQYAYEDLSLSEISERTGISRQGVRDCLDKAEKTLKRYESVLHLSEKSRRVAAAADAIAACAEEIADASVRSEIVSLTETILGTLEQ